MHAKSWPLGKHYVLTLRGKRGAMLMDAIIAIYLLLVVALVLSVMLAGSAVSRRLADERTKATCIANRELEAVKSLGYQNLTFTSLQFYGLTDTSTSSTVSTFTTCGAPSDRVSTILSHGTGTITITDVTATVRRVVVTVTWLSKFGNHSVSVSTEVGKLT